MYVLTNAQTGEELTREESKADINTWLLAQSPSAEICYGIRYEA